MAYATCDAGAKCWPLSSSLSSNRRVKVREIKVGLPASSCGNVFVLLVSFSEP